MKSELGTDNTQEMYQTLAKHNSSKHVTTDTQANVSEALCSGAFASDNNTDGILAREVKIKINSF